MIKVLILGIFIGATIGYITAALMAAPNYSEIPTSSTAKDDLAVEEEPEISEAIKHIENMRKGIYLVYPEKLYDFIIQTLREYQEVHQIVDAYVTDDPKEPMYDTEDYMDSIREIIDKYKAESEEV